jgi:hypothetical protein
LSDSLNNYSPGLYWGVGRAALAVRNSRYPAIYIFIYTVILNWYDGIFFKRGGLMYLLYLDDSGSAPNPKEEYFVLGGLCISEHRVSWLIDRINKFVESIEPQNPDAIELHASEIFSGRISPWDRFRERQQRANIIKNALHCMRPAKDDTVIFACAVHKKSYVNNDPVEFAFENISLMFERFLQRKYNSTKQSDKRRYNSTKQSDKGIIIIDKSSYETSLQKLALNFHKQGIKRKSLKFIREVPFFVDSRASRLIQIADNIAYAVFRRYEHGDLNYFNCIEDRFDRYDGVIHGLSHLQTDNPNCTCPVCITRFLKPNRP